MPKSLSEQQLEWLELATQKKGRFTLKSSIKKDWENYVRRRDKVAENSAGLPPDNPTKKLVDNALKDADTLAKAGKFSEAYKSLDQAKALGKSASTDRAKTVSIGSILTRLDTAENRILMEQTLAGETINAYQSLLSRIGNISPVSAQPDLESASRRHKQIVDQKTLMWADLLNCEARSDRVGQAIRADKVPALLEEIGRDIAVHKTAGHEKDVARHEQRMLRLQGLIDADNKRLATDGFWIKVKGTRRGEFETAFKGLLDLSRFAGRQGDTKDDLTEQARGKLTGDDQVRAKLEDDEKKRLDQAKLAWRNAGQKDAPLSQMTDSPDVDLAPELGRFDATDMLDEVMEQVLGGGMMPGKVEYLKAKELVTAARGKLKAILAQLPPGGPEVFDLMLKSPADLAKMCGLPLTGSDNPEVWTDEQKIVLNQMGKDLREEILQSSPNKMKSDGSEITVNGQKYTLVAVIGKGANGKVSRYTDGTNTVVVKSMLAGDNQDQGEKDHAFDIMAKEMRTHRQMQEGVTGSGGTTDNLAEMKGTAVDETGGLHMMMEDIDGGNLEELSEGLSLLTDLGILPDDARRAIALDFVTQATKGLKSMQDVGLVHNDLKPGNMMLTRDGKVKIIDFGESRFVDEDTGLAPGPTEGGYATTKGYDSPQHNKDQKVDGKADNYGMSKILRVAMDRKADVTVRLTKVEPVGVLGRIAEMMEDEDPSKRPTLEALLMSSALAQGDEQANPEAVRELQQAATETTRALKDLKVPVNKAAALPNVSHRKASLDTSWVRAFDGDPSPTPLLSMKIIASMTSSFELLSEVFRKDIVKASPELVQALREELAVVEGKRRFWTELGGRTMKEQRDVGRQEIETIEKDDTQQIDVPGKGGGKMTVKAAVALRASNTEQIKGLQDDFYGFADVRPEEALAWLDKTNEVLLAFDTQNKAITAAITELLGPAGRYVAAETKLVELSRAFSPVARDSGMGGPKDTRTEGEEEGDLPPLPEGVIPEPPPLPKDKVKEK